MQYFSRSLIKAEINGLCYWHRYFMASHVVSLTSSSEHHSSMLKYESFSTIIYWSFCRNCSVKLTVSCQWWMVS